MKGTSDNKNEANRPPKNLILRGVCFLQFYCQMLPKAFSAIVADFMSYRVTMFWIQGDGLLDSTSVRDIFSQIEDCFGLD